MIAVKDFEKLVSLIQESNIYQEEPVGFESVLIRSMVEKKPLFHLISNNFDSCDRSKGVDLEILSDVIELLDLLKLWENGHLDQILEYPYNDKISSFHSLHSSFLSKLKLWSGVALLHSTLNGKLPKEITDQLNQYGNPILPLISLKYNSHKYFHHIQDVLCGDLPGTTFVVKDTLFGFYSIVLAVELIIAHAMKQDCSQQFKDNMDKMKFSLNSINDLNYRLQVMQNVFSLLFLRKSDLEEPLSESDLSSDTQEDYKSIIKTTSTKSPTQRISYSQSSHSSNPKCSSIVIMEEDIWTDNLMDKIPFSGFLCKSVLLEDFISILSSICETSLGLISNCGTNASNVLLLKEFTSFHEKLAEGKWKHKLVNLLNNSVDTEASVFQYKGTQLTFNSRYLTNTISMKTLNEHVRYMLSPGESLLLMLILKQLYTVAQKAVQVFALDKSWVNSFLLFSIQFSELVNNLLETKSKAMLSHVILASEAKVFSEEPLVTSETLSILDAVIFTPMTLFLNMEIQVDEHIQEIVTKLEAFLASNMSLSTTFQLTHNLLNQLQSAQTGKISLINLNKILIKIMKGIQEYSRLIMKNDLSECVFFKEFISNFSFKSDLWGGDISLENGIISLLNQTETQMVVLPLCPSNQDHNIWSLLKKLIKLFSLHKDEIPDEDYFNALYKYCKQLSEVPFPVADFFNSGVHFPDDSVSDIAYKLVCRLRLNPSSLKSWAMKLGIDLPYVLSKSLCKSIALEWKGRPDVFLSNNWEFNVFILNPNQRIQCDLETPPDVYVRKLLRDVWSFYRDIVITNEVEDLSKVLLDSKLHKRILALSGLDLELLTDVKEILSFWLNMVNLLILYTKTVFKLHNYSYSCPTAIEKICWESCIAFNINGHILTISHIKYSILSVRFPLGGCNILPLALGAHLNAINIRKLPKDIVQNAVFGICGDENYELHVFKPSSVMVKLLELKQIYLDNNMKLDVEKQTIYVSGHLQYYCKEDILELLKDGNDINIQSMQEFQVLSGECSELIPDSNDESDNEENSPREETLVHYIESECWIIGKFIKRISCEPTDARKNSLPIISSPTSLDSYHMSIISNYKIDHGVFWRNLQNLYKEMYPSVEYICTIQSYLEHPTIGSPILKFWRDLATVECILSSDFTRDLLSDYLIDVESPIVIFYCITYMKNILDVESYGLFMRILIDKVESYNQNFYRIMKDEYDRTMLYMKIANSNPEWSLQDVQHNSVSNPDYMLEILEKCVDFDLIMKWTECHNLNIASQTAFRTNYIFYLLDKYPADVPSALQIFEQLPLCTSLSLCDKLVSKVSHIDTLIKFLACLESKPYTSVEKERVAYYMKIKWGLQMLKCIPLYQRKAYKHLLSKPVLMIEQLVMNVKFQIIKNILENIDITPNMRKDIDDLLFKYAEKALDLNSYLTDNSENVGPSIENKQSEDSFIYLEPSTPIPRKDWTPDHQAKECMVCQVEVFTMFTRRHHCRNCGKVVCSRCSPHQLILPGYNNVPVRVCSACYILRNSNHCKSGMTTPGSLYTVDQSSISTSDRVLQWQLDLEELHNEVVREEFSFDHTPSITLCLILLGLCSDKVSTASYKMLLCNKLFSLFVPKCVDEYEVDHRLVLNMIQSLAVSAKITYSQDNLQDSMAKCDSLLVQAHIYLILINANQFSFFPTEGNLFHDVTSLHKLCDSLVKEELWDLALEVSTKGGLDQTGLWALWGKACLKSGSFKSARIKFAKCFQAVSSKSQSMHIYSRQGIVEDILNIIEGLYLPINELAKKELINMSTVKVGTKCSVLGDPALSILNSIMSVSNIINGTCVAPLQKKPTGVLLDECLYYIRMYGTPSTALKFYNRHGMVEEALSYILADKVEPEIFHENLFMPQVRMGHTHVLLKQLNLVSNNQEQWTPYLQYCCKSLEKDKMWHLLYEIQVFSQDHVRAALSCVMIYRCMRHKGSSSHLDKLNVALKHFQDYMKGGDPWRLGKESEQHEKPLQLRLDFKEVNKYMGTITLEIETQNYLVKWLSGTDSSVKDITLLGDPKGQVQTAALVLTASKNIEDGFGFVYRIIQELKLPQTEVYCEAAQELLRASRQEDVHKLVNCLSSSGSVKSVQLEEITLKILDVLLEQNIQTAEVEKLLETVNSIPNRVGYYLKLGRLKTAYLVSVKAQDTNLMQSVKQEAILRKQTAIVTLCQKWLRSNDFEFC